MKGSDMPPKNKSLNATLLRLTHHYSDAKDLFNAVRAALAVMIDQCETDRPAVRTLHRLALQRRGEE
ncbi:hypothetical protein [Bosea psychrotolerans]|uniref:Uncharacterized protein n=1 Tax=Bosea psychrotolerans TaxID=1871628 RepID=A0A2S4LYK5_9HYPH|nr:hypothetical protein [Bosea psychrotolerans]POR47543.1 hypothetical protein CYD53_1189 [Bosea psychrotolerans]